MLINESHTYMKMDTGNGESGIADIQSSQHMSDVDTRQLRATFNKVILSKLESSLNDDEEIKSLFDCIKSCVTNIPWLLVSFENDEVSSETVKQNRRDSTAFTKWLVAQLFQLVAKSKAKSLQLLAPESLISIFHLARTTNLSTFKILINDLIELILAVYDAEEFVCNNDTSCELNCLPNDINGLYDDEILSLPRALLEIKGRDGIDRIFHTILLVLSEMLSGLILHNSKLIQVVWTFLATTLNRGTFANKKLALNCLKLLSECNEYPNNVYVYQYVTSILLSLLEFLYTSPENYSKLRDTEIDLVIILDHLLSTNFAYVDHLECATVLCKVHREIKSSTVCDILSDIIIKIAIHDSSLTIPWDSIAPSGSKTTEDVEWMAIVKCNIILHEANIYGFEKWIYTPTWKKILENFKSRCSQCENILKEMLQICDILAIMVVMAKNGKHDSSYSSILESSHQFCLSIIESPFNWTSSDITNFYETVICYSSLLLKLQEWEPLCQESSLTLAFLISLPWLENSSTLDLSCTKLMKNKTLLNAASCYLSDNYKSQALHYLAMLPSETASKWRIWIFKKELLSKANVLANSALQSLSWFFHMLGMESVSCIEQSLRILITEDVKVWDHNKLVSVFLQITCAICGCTTIKWCSEGSQRFRTKSTLMCTGTSSLPQDRKVKLFCEKIWQYLFTHSNPDVRLDVTLNLSHLLQHFSDKDGLIDLCLPYLEDSCYKIQNLFCRCTQIFAFFFSNPVKPSHQSTLLSRVQSIYSIAKEKGDINQIETLVISIATLAKVNDAELFQFAIIFLLENVHSIIVGIRVTATIQIREVALFKKLSSKQLFINCSYSVSKFLCKLLYEAQERGDNKPLDIIKTTVHAFELKNLNDALKLMMPYLLPLLLENLTESTCQLINVIAVELSCSSRDLIFNEFKHIFCHLICNCTQEIRNKVLTYVVKETGATTEDILSNHSQLIYNELMLHLASNKEEAVAALCTLRSRSRQTSALASTEMFLGFLAFFDGYVFDTDVGMESKQLAVRSLEEAIKLMGSKNLSTVHMKALATLRILLKIKDCTIIPLCCRAWLAFIQTLDPSLVGSTLNQIVVALLPVVNTCLQGITEILNYIIVQKRDVFKNYFCDLYCIPDIPEFTHFIKIIRDCTGVPKSKKDLKEILHSVINGIVHENIDVRTHTLNYLINLLMQHQETFQSLVMEEDSVDTSVSQLIDKLVLSCKDNDCISQNLVGKCLGKLGAIDPTRLQIENNSLNNGKVVEIYFSIEEDNFVVELLTTLTKAFLGAPDNFVQNSASFALQEVLQVFDIINSSQKASSKGGRIWNMLSENIKDNLELHFHSRFVCEENIDYNKLHGKPIYNSPFGRSFAKWLSTWTEYLISKVTHLKTKGVFWVCRKIVRHDIKVALFLLPYVLLYVIQENNEEFVNEAVQEVSFVLESSTKTKNQTETDLNRLSVQVIFTLVDYFNNWVLLRLKRLSNTETKRNEKNNIFKEDYVSLFLKRIPKYLLAEASYNAQTYARALMNLEAHVKADQSSLNSHLEFFLKLYKALDEPDGVAGITHVSQSSTLHDQILNHENSGRHQDALLSYQRAIVADSKDLHCCEGYLRCLMELDFPQTALVYSTGVLSQNPTWTRPMKSYQVEAAWKLANWEALDSYLAAEEPLNPTWGYKIGKILSSVSHKDKDNYLKELNICRGDQVLPLSAASLESGSYERAYEYVLRIHMLEEIDQAVETFFVSKSEDNCLTQINKLIQQWQFRQKLIRTSKKCLEPILNLRRVLLGMAADHFGDNLSSTIKLEIGRLWLQSAKIARRCGQLQPDYSSILSSYLHLLPEVGPEQAKWHWLKGEKDQAMICLNKTINEIYPSFTNVTLNMKAKAALLLARYSEESSNLESSVIIRMFRDAVKINSAREDSHYFLARYYDRILTAAGRIDKQPDMVPLVIKHFGQSLKYGCRFVHMSMPRLLSLWLEFGSLVAEVDRKNFQIAQANSTLIQNSLRKTLNVINSSLINEFTATLPSYLFYTAFSQLVSRICHSHQEVFNHLKEIIAKILVDYPQQAMWLMTAVSKSSYPTRAQRCHEIFRRACQLSNRLNVFQSDVNKLTDLFVNLCNKPVDAQARHLKVSTHFKNLKQLLDNPKFSKIVLPCQLSLSVILPSVPDTDVISVYNPFPSSLVFIQSIEDQIEVMPSLQKPKKITIRGSDGKLYSLMCKPKDDLRKDCRLMEFNLVVNKFLMKDPEARRRHLHIRTYAVVPLNDECGLIEWVPNLNTLRGILLDIYKEKNIFASNATVRNAAPSRVDSPARKLEIFTKTLLPLFPSVLSEWFLKTFPNPTSWYFAQSSYAHTSAVMSVVGYILGLGDRHGENILLDSSCGDTVHVDFNCLFNKGETFDWPEVVPFRLTHNMVDALGPLGYQGVYSKSCEATLRVMRKEMDTLMSFLKPFIYDPLVEWSRTTRNQPSVSSRSSGEIGEITNEMAKVHVQDIELRLTGVMKKNITGGQGKNHQTSPFPLSIEGQVATLIKQATDLTNLSQMYIGWAAYM